MGNEKLMPEALRPQYQLPVPWIKASKNDVAV